jgi:hypothetical protein
MDSSCSPHTLGDPAEESAREPRAIDAADYHEVRVSIRRNRTITVCGVPAGHTRDLLVELVLGLGAQLGDPDSGCGMELREKWSCRPPAGSA